MGGPKTHESFANPVQPAILEGKTAKARTNPSPSAPCRAGGKNPQQNETGRRQAAIAPRLHRSPHVYPFEAYTTLSAAFSQAGSLKMRNPFCRSASHSARAASPTESAPFGHEFTQ